MVAQRVACQTPWGEAHDLVVVEDHIVVPGELADMRSLWWLAAEHHPRLAVTALSVLERATGAPLAFRRIASQRSGGTTPREVTRGCPSCLWAVKRADRV